MSEADKDGRIARELSDSLRVLSMEISESLLASQERFEALTEAARKPVKAPKWPAWIRALGKRP